MNNQAHQAQQVTQGYVDLAVKAKAAADQRRAEVDRIVQGSEPAQHQAPPSYTY